MDQMFANCIRFNQDISNWVLNRRVIERVVREPTYSRVFENCPIQPEYKPWRTEPAPVRVNALQVHQAAANIGYGKLNEFLKTKIQKLKAVLKSDEYARYIKSSLNFITEKATFTDEKKAELMAKIDLIYRERLKKINYREKSEAVRNSIINSLQYVKRQPENFKQMYVEAFVEDCIHAYQGVDGMTCANGALERIIFSLVPAFKTDPGNPEYITLEKIIAPAELIKASILDWYKLHNPNKPENVGAVAFPVETPIEEKRADLRRYLLRLYPDNTVLIDKLIESHAEALEDDDFTYGGKRRNSTKRKRRNRRINKTRKRQKNKTKKTIHKRKNRT
jgi:hypothetical protein